VQIKHALATMSLWASRLARAWRSDWCSRVAISPEYVGIGMQAPPDLRRAPGTKGPERGALVLQKDSPAARGSICLLRIVAFPPRFIAVIQSFTCLALRIARAGRRWLPACIVNWSRWVIAAAFLLSGCERDKTVDSRFTIRGAAEHASTAISDSTINQAVLRSLREGPGIDASRIVATTKGGIVELTGEVGTLFAKGRAVKLAQSVNGVRGVDDHVAVRLEQRPDKDLTIDVSRAILQIDLASSSSIAANARDGIVTLTGCVRSHQARDIAGRIAESARGAREVRNELTLDDTPDGCVPVTGGAVRKRTDAASGVEAGGSPAGCCGGMTQHP